jgi:hypothetical protein
MSMITDHKIGGVVLTFSSGINCVHYGLESCIFVEVDDSWTIGSSKAFIDATYKEEYGRYW